MIHTHFPFLRYQVEATKRNMKEGPQASSAFNEAEATVDQEQSVALVNETE